MAQAAEYLKKSPWFPSLYTCLNESAVTGLDHVMKDLPSDGINQWLEDIRSSLPTCEYRAIFLISPVLTAMLVSTIYTLFAISGIKIYSKKLKLDFPTSMKQLNTIWICLNSVLTIGLGAFTVHTENIFFFFKPSTSFLYWDTCVSTPELIEVLIFFRMGFHLHSFLVLLIEPNEKKMLHRIKLYSHLVLFGLLGVTHFIGFFEPIVVLLLLFEVREFLWHMVEYNLYTSKAGLTQTGIIALAACIPYQCICIVHWLITKFIYFFAVIYPVKSKQTPFYFLILSMFLAVFAIEVWRLYAMVMICFKDVIYAKKKKQVEQSHHKKQE